jgi:hypothetical protein
MERKRRAEVKKLAELNATKVKSRNGTAYPEQCFFSRKGRCSEVSEMSAVAVKPVAFPLREPKEEFMKIGDND